MRLQSISENTIMMTLPNNPDLSTYLIAVKHHLDNQAFILETVIGYRTITVYFNPLQVTHQEILTFITATWEQKQAEQIHSTLHHIPVCYDKAFGIDIEHVMKEHQLSLQKIIALHTTPTYNVSFLGFSPGFPFLTGMNQHLATPRKNNPRLEVPKGSVGIAGGQTGIYPSTSPGGWQIIGRTPINLLPLDADRPTLLVPGDQIRFYPINKTEFEQLQKEERIKNGN
ncbi:inhibitor of KinA [Gracilibacillus orientalis]|uniref:Inhibitor of KinA n=1 Tax=Gracilibacillus orientalis TaxID=334253 RepID=A0A1I4P9A3_9BACI|nr:5-oxoprolinase subunit PxpB [Gracilibacillus orientalis]SFM24205.1 inhibitor of KinA [Gracilibacillus orientalis]